MVFAVEATLNVAAAVIVAVLVATTVSPDWTKLVAMSYVVLLVILFVVPNGGQVNVALALAAAAHAMLTALASDPNLPGSYVSQREKVKIFDGIMIAKTNVGKMYNTYDPTSTSYKRLARSVNRVGGAQFTYSFWLMFDRGVSDEQVAGKTILLRGDKKRFSPKVNLPEDPGTPDGNYFESGLDYTIACPRISFLAANQIAVDINTNTNLRHRFVIGSSEEGVDMRKNLLSLIPGKFALLTFVLEDNIGIDSFENGVRLKFYFNGTLYHQGKAPGALRHNNGPLHLFLDEDPDGTQGIDNCRIADLTYYNYALEHREVAAMYERGYTNKQAKDSNTVFDKDMRLHIDDRNRLDLSNYDDRLHSYPA